MLTFYVFCVHRLLHILNEKTDLLLYIIYHKYCLDFYLYFGPDIKLEINQTPHMQQLNFIIKNSCVEISCEKLHFPNKKIRTYRIFQGSQWKCPVIKTANSNNY